MSQIAHATGGSKGTLYTYFNSKGDIFAEFIMAEINHRVAVTFSLSETVGEVEADLRTIGRRYVALFSDATVLDLYRSVITEYRRFPEISRCFMDAGPRTARQMLALYFADVVETGALPIIDVERAAQQFLALCQGNLLHDLLLGATEAPKAREIERQVDVALDAFFAIYPPKSH